MWGRSLYVAKSRIPLRQVSMFFGIGELLVVGITVVVLSVLGREGLKNIGERLNDGLREAKNALPVFSAAGTDGKEAEFIDDNLYNGKQFLRFILLTLLLVTLASLFIKMLCLI